jgi:hypothetical protein
MFDARLLAGRHAAEGPQRRPPVGELLADFAARGPSSVNQRFTFDIVADSADLAS